MFSKACEYGIRAMLFVAEKSVSKQRVNVKEVAKAIDSPVAFTAKVLQALSKHGLIQSIKGLGGGYELRETKKEVQLGEIVRAIDGEGIFTKCGLGLANCNDEKPCPMHEQLKPIRDQLVEVMTNSKLQELAVGVQSGRSFLKN